MTIWKTEHYRNASRERGAGWYLDLAALIGIVAAPGLFCAWLMPLPFLLPVICMVSFLIACSFAAFALYTRADRRSAEVTAWDVAALFTLVWIGAGFASNPVYLVRLFEILASSS